MEEDILLIEKFLGGDQGSLRVLIDKYTPSIYNFTSRFVGINNAPDITQDIFIKVWKNLERFDKDKSQFKTWLFAIARNSITDHLRKKRSISFSGLGEDFDEEEIGDEAISIDEEIDKLRDKEILIKLIDELPDHYKLVLTLHYQEDMTFKEIGEVLGKPLNTVKSYHHRALTLLKNTLDSESLQQK